MSGYNAPLSFWRRTNVSDSNTVQYAEKQAINLKLTMQYCAVPFCVGEFVKCKHVSTNSFLK